MMGWATTLLARAQPPQRLGVKPSRGLAIGLLALAMVLLAPVTIADAYRQQVLVLIFMTATLGTAWNIIGGYTGQPALGNALFFGVGAYASAFLFKEFRLTPWVGIAIGVLLACGIATISGYPCFRLKGHQFAISTLALSLIALELFRTWPLVGGSSGLSVPFATQGLLTLQFSSPTPYYYLFLCLLAAALAISWSLRRSRTGYYLRAIRGDEEAALSVGIPVSRFKLRAYLWAAGITAVCGGLYVQFTYYIDPDSAFSTALSIQALLVVMVGGIGTLWGPVVGSALLTGLGEATRVTLGGTGMASDLVIYGALIVVFAVFQPSGLAGLGRRLQVARRRWPRGLR